MTDAVVKLQDDIIPTKDTKLVLAGVVTVPPIGKYKLDGKINPIKLLKRPYI